MDSALVYKSNALVEASYRLSVYEQRIILACIAQVRRDEPLTDQQLYAVSAQQIADMTGTQLGTTYQNLKAASERLYRREVTLHEAPNGEGKGKVRLTRWVQTVEYREAEGLVALRFGADMVPYLSQLSAQFTRYALADVAKMDSAYGIRLYELLCQWRDAGEREVSIEWLRDAFQLGDKYPAIKDFKRWVLEPAVAQINEHSPLQVIWTQRKTGRRVTHLAFTFAPKEAAKKRQKPAAPPAEKPRKPKESAGPQQATGYLAFVLSQLKMTEAEFNAAARPGEDHKQAFARLKRERRGVTAD